MNVLILYSSAGRGHYSAAAAIEQELLASAEANIMVTLDDPVVASNRLSRAMVWLYNTMVKYCPWSYKYYVRYLNWSKPHIAEGFKTKTYGYLAELYRRVSPDIIISVYPMTNHIPKQVCDDIFTVKNVPFLVFNTDPFKQFLHAWVNPDVTLQLCPSSDNVDESLRLGAIKSSTRVVQYPIRREFTQRSKNSVKERLLVINCGFSGVARYADTGVIDALSRECLIGIVCGGNITLYQSLEQRYAGNRSVEVYGLLSAKEMAALYSRAQYSFGKVGAATLYECLALDVTLLVDTSCEVMPQERDIVTYIEREGVGLSIDKIHVLLSAVQRTDIDYQGNRNRLRTLAQPNYRVASLVLELLQERL